MDAPPSGLDSSFASESSAVSRASQILSFLDKVETETDDDLRSCVAGSIHADVSVFKPSKDESENDSTLLNSKVVGFEGIKEKLVSLKVQLEDKTKTCELLQQSMEQLKLTQEKKLKELESEHLAVLKDHKKESEATIQRHLGFVDRLLADKETLSNKCDELAQKIRDIDQEYVSRIEKIHIEHRRMLKRAKETWIASESVRREQWIQNKTKSIKAMTIKGLEPEIERLIETNKRTIAQKDQDVSDALRQQREELLDEHEAKVSEIRARWMDEKTEEISLLQSQHAEAMKQQHDMLRTEFDEQKCRLESQFSQERHRLLDEHERLKQQHMDNVSQIEKAHDEEIKKLKSLHQDELSNEKRHHEIGISKTEERCRIEKNEWQEMMTRKLQQEFEKKEEAMRSRLQSQQREELDVVIDRLTRDFEKKMENVSRQHETELADRDQRIENVKEDLQSQLDRWLEKCAAKDELIAQMKREQDDSIAETKRCMKQLTGKEAEVMKLQEQMNSQKSDVEGLKKTHGESIRQQKLLYQEQLRVLEDKCDSLQEEIDSMNASQAEQLRQISENHSMELEGIEAKVRQMVCKKDDVIHQLRDQISSKDARISQIEELLEQQRAELLAQM